MTLLLIAAGTALAVSFFCSLLEATLLSYTPSQVAALEARRPRLFRIWRSFKDNIEKPISVILVTNTISHTVGATIAGAQAERVFGAQGLILFSLVFTALMLQFTEILPKSLGVRYNENLAPVIARPLDGLTRLMAPLIWLIHLINRPFERGGEVEDTTLEQISGLAAAARFSRLIDPQQARMIEAASEFEAIRVRQIMTPRTEVVSIRVDQPIEEILDAVRRSPYTRLPLCEGNVDNIIGVVNVKDLFKALDLVPGRFQLADTDEAREAGEVAARPGAGKHVFGSGAIDLMEIKRDLLVFPQSLNILKALRRFQVDRQHMAVVVNEYGATEGIVTLEDVIEQMVGEIEDEFDPLRPKLVKQEGESYRVSGRVPLHELSGHIPRFHIEHTEESVDTVGGYVVQHMNRLPNVGDSVRDGAWKWTVTKADAKQVHEVLLTPAAGAEEAVDAEESQHGE